MNRRPRHTVHTTLATAIALLAWASPGAADGEGPIAHGRTGNHELTVLVAPRPVCVGETSWSILVRDHSTGAFGIEVPAELLLVFETDGPTPGERRIAQPLRRPSPDQPLHTARIAFPSSGLWRGRVEAKGADAPAPLLFEVQVEPAAGSVVAHWRSLAIAPVTLACFSLHQWLVGRRRSPRRAR